MKYLFYTLLVCSSLLNVQAQNCLPDSTYRDSSTGVYPRPITMDNPNGGITKKACINKPYDFTFTVVVPDSITTPQFPAGIPIDKVSIDTAGAIKNLPNGIDYACNPPNCVYPKNTIGCLILLGVPDTTNTPGDFKPTIKLKVTVNLGIPVDFEVDYPGPAFPGEYILSLLSEANCLIASKDIDATNSNWYPNPSEGVLYSLEPHCKNIRIYNANGHLIFQEKNISENKIQLSAKIPNGLYIIHWTSKESNYIQKLILNRQ